MLPCAYAAGDEAALCAGKADDRARLACYDTLNAVNKDASLVTRGYLARSWDLDNRDEELTGERQSPLRPHHVTYLIARRSGHANVQPVSPAHAPSSSLADVDLSELKFQISQKAKIFNPVSFDFLGITGARLWGAYTQQSNWQAFNAGNSSPFRETNYEPELIMTLRTVDKYGLKLVNVGYVHQSNGREANGSRSWNRTYIQAGLENGTLSVLLRGWWRIPENIANDDNPDIEEYVGRGDISLRWEPLDHSQVLDLTLRNNFQARDNRGFVQLDWATPVVVSKSTKLHVQFTSGYGESLIDYNFYQNTFGFGVSFRDW